MRRYLRKEVAALLEISDYTLNLCVKEAGVMGNKIGARRYFSESDVESIRAARLVRAMRGAGRPHKISAVGHSGAPVGNELQVCSKGHHFDITLRGPPPSPLVKDENGEPVGRAPTYCIECYNLWKEYRFPVRRTISE